MEVMQARIACPRVFQTFPASRKPIQINLPKRKPRPGRINPPISSKPSNKSGNPNAIPLGSTSYLFDDWFDPIEAGLRDRVRGFIETMLETELNEVLARPRYGRRCEADDGGAAGVAGHRHGSRMRRLTGTFGASEITVPRARLDAAMARRRNGRARPCAPISGARRPPTR
jgi:hypothetical protein